MAWVSDKPASSRTVLPIAAARLAKICASGRVGLRVGAIALGSATKGSSGNPRPHDLGNGVTVFLSVWEDQLPDGSVLEGKGVTPDIEVEQDPVAVMSGGDPQLARGIAEVMKRLPATAQSLPQRPAAPVKTQ